MDLDTLVRETVKRVVEGGKALGGDRISRADIDATFKSFREQLLEPLGLEGFLIGSAGMKPDSGDLDVAVGKDADLDAILKRAEELGLKAKFFKSLDQVSVLFPQSVPGKTVQIDTIKGDKEYVRWSHPSPSDSKYKGFYTRAIANAVIQATTGLHVNVTRGLFSKDDKEKKYSTDLGALAQKMGPAWKPEDLTMSLEKIWDKAKRVLNPEQIQQVREYVREFMANKKAPFPEELNEAASPNDPFERLHDAIVANLPKVRRITEVPPQSIPSSAVFRPKTMAIHVVSTLQEPWKSIAVAHEAGHIKDLDTPEKIKRAQYLVGRLRQGQLSEEEGQEYLQLEQRGWDNAKWFLQKAGIPIGSDFQARMTRSMETHRRAVRSQDAIGAAVEEAVGKVVRGVVPAYGNVRGMGTVPQRKHGAQVGQGNIGGARNRGVPGYPVPPEMYNRRGSEGFEDPGGIEVLEAKDPHQHTGTCLMLDVPESCAKRLQSLGATEDPSDMHITLFYRKGLTEEEMDAVERIWGDIWSEHAAPLELKLMSVGTFEPSESSDGKQVVYAKVEEDIVPKLRQELVDRLKEEEGIEPDDTHPDFKPHITLAYIEPDAKNTIDIDEPVKCTIEKYTLQRGVPKGQLDEAVDPSELEYGIKHVDDLSPAEFMEFLKKYANEPLRLEISEKVDGSARMSFGIGGGSVWTQTKTGSRKALASQYPDNTMFRPVRKAHEALETKRQQIIDAWPEGVSFMVAEVLYGKIPNAIEYGENRIIVHGVHGYPNTLGDAEARKAAQQVIKAIGGVAGDFHVEYKRTVSRKDVEVSIRTEYDTLGQLYDDLSKRPRDKATKEQFKRTQKAVKEKLLKAMAAHGSAYGPKDGDVEGFVIRDVESGELYKLVDRDYFKQLKDFMWSWRDRLNKDVLGGFRKVVAREVLGDESLASNRLVSNLLAQGAPAEGKPEVRADKLIAAYIQKHGLMRGEFAGTFKTAVNRASDELKRLENEWAMAKDAEISSTIQGKTRTFDQGVKDRTTGDIQDARAALEGVKAGVQVAEGIQDELSRKVAIFKLFMGHQFRRLVDKLGGGEDLQEGLFGFGQQSVPSGNIHTITRDMIRKYPAQLEKRVGVPTSNWKYIDSGAYADVFDLKNGKVLKVTRDEEDARASSYFMKNPMKHIVHVFDVFAFPSVQGEYYRLFGIINEKLEALDQDEHAAVDEAWPILTHSQKRSWEEMKFEYQHNPQVVEKMHAYGLDEMIDDFAKSGFSSIDLHAGNLMKRRDGTIVVSDLGVSESSGDLGSVSQVEKKIREGGPIDRMTGATDLSGAPRVDDVGLDDAQAANEASNLLKGITAATMLGLASPVAHDQAPPPQPKPLPGPTIRYPPQEFDVFKHVQAVAKKHRVDPRLVMAVVKVESGHDRMAVSSKGAKGLMQLMPATAKAMGVDDPHDPAQNLDGGTRYLAYLLKMFKGDIDSALAAYNAGPKTVRDHDPSEYPLETQEYVRRVKAEFEKLRGQREGIVKEATGVEYVGATIGRFQPFHAGHAEMIRKLAQRFTRVLVFVAGLKKDPTNPFSYDLRVQMMEKSLPDVWSKIHVFKAEIAGKGSGYIPGLVAQAQAAGAVEPGQPVSVLVGEDRLGAVQKQVEHNKAHQDQPGYFNGTIEVSAIPGVRNEDDVDRISGTRVRQAIMKKDRKALTKMLDPHLASDPSVFEQIVAELEREGGGAPTVPEIVEQVIAELGMGGLETGPGATRGGSWGTSGWSRAVLAKDDDGEEMFQQMIRSPSTRMLPMTNHGTPNSDLPSVNRIDDEPDGDQLRNPTDLTEMVEEVLRRLLGKR